MAKPEDYSDLNLLPLEAANNSGGSDDYSDLGLMPLESQTNAVVPPTPNPSVGDATKSAIQSLANAPKQIASAVSSPENLYKTTGRYWPEAGMVAGNIVAPGLGTAIGAGAGQITRNLAGLAYGDPNAPRTALGAAVPAMTQTALAGLPQTKGIQDFTQNLGRRALGITKGMMKRLPGGVDQANQAAQEMLNQGVIGPSAENTLSRAQDIAQSSGQAIGDTLRKAGTGAANTQDIASQIIDQLAPPRSGGAYDIQHKIASDIVDTVMAHGEGPIDLESAQALKKTLSKMAGANWNTDNLKAAMYQKAYGIVNKAIDDGLQNAVASGQIPASDIPQFMANKKTYGAAQLALSGLRDKTAAEAANNILSLRGAAIGAGALAAGHVTPALEALGVWELAQRGGTGLVAPLLNKIYSGPTSMAGTALGQKLGQQVTDYIQSYKR